MYILMVVFLAGYGPKPDIVMQEFSSANSCKVAQREVVAAWARKGDDNRLVKVLCLPK